MNIQNIKDTVLTYGEVTHTLKRSFWDMVSIDNGDRCWPFKKMESKRKYGRVRIITNNIPYTLNAHKVSYILTKGNVPREMQVLHTCDNTRCVNPSHLYLGTRSDNGFDISERNRNKRFKLTHKQRMKMIEEYESGKGSLSFLAKKYGVSVSNVSQTRIRYKKRKKTNA